MCQQTIVYLLCRNAGCSRVMWEDDFGITPCEQIQKKHLKADHELELIDLDRTSEGECNECISQRVNTALKQEHPRNLFKDEADESSEGEE